METYKLIVHKNSAFEEHIKALIANKNQGDRKATNLSVAHIRMETVGNTIKDVIVARFTILCIITKTPTQHTIELSESVLQNLRSIREGILKSRTIPKFSDVINDQTVHIVGRSIPFSIDTKSRIPYPYTRQCAAGIIMAFFNGTMDPFDRITAIAPSLEHDPQLILVTYYLSCISYILEIDLSSVLTEDDGFFPFMDDTILVKLEGRQQYDSLITQRDIPVVDICFHALYGAYTFCRAVATKNDFNGWVTKRYNALRAGLQQTTVVNSNLKLQVGGTHVNAISSGRYDLKRVVLSIIRKEDMTDNRSISVRGHIKLLTQLSEMTTYSMINKVIGNGGPIMVLNPITDQLSKFAKEKQKVVAKLQANNVDPSEIVYLTLIFPNEPYFTSTEYPDMIVAAQALEKVKDPKSRTIDQYKAKVENAKLAPKIAVAFYQHQLSSQHLLSTPTEEQIATLKTIGVDLGPLVKDAQKILEIIRRQGEDI